MSNTQQCPSVEQLKQLAVGLLPDPLATSLEVHLLECGSCVQQTAQLQHADTLLLAIKHAGQARSERSPEEVARLERLMTSLSGLCGEPEDATRLSHPSGSSDATGLSDDVTREWTALWRPPESADELGRIGSYRILKVLGAGGMGGVFLAEDMQLQRRVALKLMRPRTAAAPGAAERFLREARAVAALRHDHIISIYQVGEEAGVPFLAMEYLEGESLDDRLKRETLPPLMDVLRIGQEIAEGLAAAHAKGLIHRDIKPANVWLESDRDETSRETPRDGNVAGFGRVKLLDFGLARPAENDTQLTASGMIIGTPSYMAPEQASAEAIDARADLFSLGVVLYRMTTGQLPFPGINVMGILKSLATVTPVHPRLLNPAVPSELSTLVVQLLAKDPNARPASAQEVGRRMCTLAHTALATDEKKTVHRTHPPKRVALSVLGLTAMILFGVIILKIKTKDGKETEVTINVPGEVSSVSAIVRDGDVAKPVSGNSVDAPPATFITLDGLDPARILESERFDWQPEELVAVIGEHRLRHWKRVLQTRFHPSGEFFITVPDSHAAKLTLTKSLESPPVSVALSVSHEGFEFSQDGKWMYSANRIYSVNMSDATNPRIDLAHTLPREDNRFGSSDVAIHDNRWLIHAADTPGELLIWDMAAQPARLIKTIKFESTEAPMEISLSTDGRWLALPTWDGKVRVWGIDWSNVNDPDFTLRDQQVPATEADWIPHTSIMAAGGEGHSNIELWDVSQTPFQLIREIESGREFAFSSDGNLVAVAAGLGFQLYAREGAGWVKRHALSDGMAAVTSLAWSPDRKTIVAGDQFGGIHVWDVSMNPPRRRNPTLPANNVTHIAISPDGRSMIASGADIMTTAWKLEGAVPARLEWEAYGEGRLSSFSHDSQLVQFYGGPWNLMTNPPTSISDPIADFPRFSPLEPSLICYHGNRLFHRDWELTKRGRFVFSNERELWRSPEGLNEFDTEISTREAFATLQFGSLRFATRQSDNTVSVWSVTDPAKPLHELQHNLQPGHGLTLTLSTDGKLLLAFSQQGSIVWDLEETPPRVYRLQLSTTFQNAFFTADSKRLFVADDSGVGIYDWANNREVRRLKYPGPVRQIVPHPDGHHLITVNSNGTVYVLRMPELLNR